MNLPSKIWFEPHGDQKLLSKRFVGLMFREEMETSEKKWIPDGFHFLGPGEAKLRRGIVNKISSILSGKGYSEVFLPAFDYTSTFSKHVMNMERGSLLRVTDATGSDISPSLDLTIQVVKGMAGVGHEGEPQDVFYTGKIVRDSIQSNGERRETTQIGAEKLGRSGKETFLEILMEIDEIFGTLDLKQPLVLAFGDVRIFSEIADHYAIDKDSLVDISQILYTKNAPLLHDYLTEKSFSQECTALLEGLLWDFEFESANAISSSMGEKQSAIQESISNISFILKEWNSRKRSIDLCIDLSLIQDLDYYTGFVFQGYLPGVARPVVTGGEYDNLFETYSGVSKRASGFAISLDLLEEKLEAK